MKKIFIQLAKHSFKYPIYVGVDLFKKFDELINLDRYTSVTVISDSIVFSLHGKSLLKQGMHAFIFKAGEKSKTLETVNQAYHYLTKNNVDRKGLIINIGGGVVTDLGGFVASTYLRGIHFINIPTTVEAMVDASFGGKNGVNLGEYKNYVGTFTQPQAVIADVDFLQTMPQRSFVQGFAEMIKHGLIQDKEYFMSMTSKKPNEFTQDELVKLIAESVRIKAQIVQQDERETGERKLLNFGHTVGHAFESLSLKTGDPLFHGEAVAIGMVAEAKISESLGMISEKDFQLIETAISSFGLPTKYKDKVSVESVMSLIQKDKKGQRGKIKWTLLSAIGVGDYNIEIDDKFAREGIKYVLD